MISEFHACRLSHSKLSMESFASRFFHGHAGKSFASRLFLGCIHVVSPDPQMKIHAELLLTPAGTYWVFFCSCTVASVAA